MRNFINNSLRIFLLASILLAGILLNCSESMSPDKNLNDDIPGDPTNISVPVPTKNNLVPNADFRSTENNIERIRVQVLGMLTESGTAFTPSASTNSSDLNFFLEEDGVLQGAIAFKSDQTETFPIDIVFTVDNSGSMSQEADSIAASIIRFANQVDNMGIDLTFGCVGYDGFIRGAINLTTVEKIENFFNTGVGVGRTVGFAGPDSLTLQANTANYPFTGENGVTGIFYALDQFNWRPGALRVFYNFTDEPTQPRGNFEWSTDSLCNRFENLSAAVYTIWSGPDTSFFNEQPLYREKPWAMSDCTGGLTEFIPGDGTGLDLASLGATSAIENSFFIEFVTSAPTDPHTIKITFKTAEGDDGSKVFQGVVY